ncbi:MAG: hypothetical protein ACTSSA_09500 [Candidatus Freyarchaeota archaeon]
MFKYEVDTLQGKFHDECNILIVLDACRYDYFQKLSEIKGKLYSLYVNYTKTDYWFADVFRHYYDLVYISANPVINSENTLGHFKKVLDLWRTKWDDSLMSVHPDDVTDVALDYLEHDLVIHYLQPHTPYIGNPHIPHLCLELEEIRRKVLGLEPLEEEVLMKKHSRYLTKPDWKLLRTGYKGNLLMVLNSVSRLLEHVDEEKKVVITSDHGELLGETSLDGQQLFGHVYKETKYVPIPYLKVEKCVS